MRRQFHPLLLDHMRRDKRIHLITADLGYGMWDAIKAEFPARYLNVYADEQLMLGTAVAWALEGRVPVCYTISPFYWRGAEWIRNYLNHEKIPVKLVGAGRGSDYQEDGFTHFDDTDILFGCFGNIKSLWPSSETLEKDTEEWINYVGPSYINLKR